jgi:hypothetical protein
LLDPVADTPVTTLRRRRQPHPAMVDSHIEELTMANEKNRPAQHPGQDDAPSDKRGPTQQPETDSSGDPVDDTGEDNHQKK